MKSEVKIQKDNVNMLKEEILFHSNNMLKKIYVMVGDVRESGYDIVEECLIDIKARKHIAFGIDKKNTTRKMLENILKYTKNVYVWDNNSAVEFSANLFVFEYDEEAIMYSFSGGLTDSLLETDICIYTKVTFDLVKDKKEYEEYINMLVNVTKQNFVKLTKEYIDELAENKLIFTTKQFVHVVPSIAELLGKSETENKVEVVEDDIKLPKLEMNSIDLESMDNFEIDLGDIDFPTNKVDEEYELKNQEKDSNIEEVETEAFGLDEFVSDIDEEFKEDISNEAIDLESMILDSEVVKLDKSSINKSTKERKEVKEKQLNKKINLANVSNIIMELAKKPTKGKDINKVKIPNYIKDMIPAFFEVMEDAKLKKTDDGEYKETTVKLEIIDVNTSNKYVDTNATLKQKVGQTYVEFESDKLVDVDYEEMDIVRIIKLARDYYHIEIIPNGIEEYKLWKKLCTNSFRGNSRQYGLM